MQKDLVITKLSQDPILNQVIEKIGILNYTPTTDFFVSIAKSIVSQQLSTKAASTIWNRFTKLFPDETVTAQDLLSLDKEAIRSTGISYPKAGYLLDLAEKTVNGSLQLNKLPDMSDEEIITHLTSVKGIGRWTAEMLLMFALHRPDILTLDDLGIQIAFEKLYKVKRGNKQKMIKVASKWRPYRTFACWYLWASLDNK